MLVCVCVKEGDCVCVCVFVAEQMWVEQRLVEAGQLSAHMRHGSPPTDNKRSCPPAQKGETDRLGTRIQPVTHQISAGRVCAPPPPGLSAKSQRRRPAISILLRKSTVEVMSESTICGRGSAGSGLSSGYRQKHLPACPRRKREFTQNRNTHRGTQGL